MSKHETQRVNNVALTGKQGHTPQGMAPGLNPIPCGLAVQNTGTVTHQQGHVSGAEVKTYDDIFSTE